MASKTKDKPDKEKERPPEAIGAEMWKKIPGIKFYRVSNHGRVKSLDRTVVDKRGGIRFLRGKLLKPGRGTYLNITIGSLETQKTMDIHRLVALVFLPPQPTPNHEINHKDFNKWNNCVNNLEWMTRAENNEHKTQAGRSRGGSLPGSQNPWSKLNEPQVRKIKQSQEPRMELARRYGVTPSLISQIRNGRAWKHVKAE